MVNHSIKVYARVKKQNGVKSRLYQIVQKKPQFEDIVFYNDLLQHGSTTCKFRFHKVFDQDTNQEDVFDIVAKPVINSVLQGFNGTVFAYGQTGSGKTFTITGSPKNYNERGIIPRSIQYIFEQNDKICYKPTIYISYMEIYNEIGYDLLSPRHNTNARGLEELPRIALLEDGKGEAHIRNLSVLPVTTEQEAMRLLFLGDTNRTIAETPVNEYSSRSHCIFTIHITFRKESSSVIRFSKLHIVDLAGSERVSKSLTTGTALNEAKYINLSLHYLQQVIVALSEEKRLHIPYRNSMMTYILKDSLSGNCLTVMMATLAASRNNLQETISTCKFAQRVSLITTEPVINELNDPQQEIILLKRKIEELEKQIAELTGITTGPNLNNDQKQQCMTEVESFLSSSMPDEEFAVKPDLKLIKFCFKLFKAKIDSQFKTNEQRKLDYYKIQKEVVSLKNAVKKKDEEITTLKNIIDQIPEKPTNPNTIVHKKNTPDVAPYPIKKIEENTLPKSKITQLKENNSFNDTTSSLNACIDDTIIHDNEKGLFEQFIANPSHSKDLRYYTQSLEKKFEMAKVYADAIEECQQKIIDIRQKLQACPNDAIIKKQLLSELEEQQEIYSRSLVDLKLLKSETRHLQSGLKQAQIKIRQRFEMWLTECQSSKTSNHTKDDQWGDVSDQYDCNVCQYSDRNDAQTCYKQENSCGTHTALCGQSDYNNSCQYSNAIEVPNCFKQDSYKLKTAHLSDCNNRCQYSNSSGPQSCFKPDAFCGMKMDQQLAYSKNVQHENVTHCCFTQDCSCEVRLANNKYSSNCTSHYSEDFSAEYPKGAVYSPRQHCGASKSYNKYYSEYSCVGKKSLFNPEKSYHCNQPDIYWNTGTNPFINTDRLCKGPELTGMLDFRQKSVNPYETCNVSRVYNNVSNQRPTIITSGDTVENNDRHHHYAKRNGLEEVEKGRYVQHKKHVGNDSSRKYEICAYRADNTGSQFSPANGYMHLPCEEEAVKEVPHLQGGCYQDQTQPLNSIGLIEKISRENTTESTNNSHLFNATDSPEFVEFMKTVPLTGEAAIDEEIYNFYRSKLY